MSIAVDMLISNPKTDTNCALAITKVERLAGRFMDAVFQLAILYGPEQAGNIAKEAIRNASYWGSVGDEVQSCAEDISQIERIKTC